MEKDLVYVAQKYKNVDIFCLYCNGWQLTIKNYIDRKCFAYAKHNKKSFMPFHPKCLLIHIHVNIDLQCRSWMFTVNLQLVKVVFDFYFGHKNLART